MRLGALAASRHRHMASAERLTLQGLATLQSLAPALGATAAPSWTPWLLAAGRVGGGAAGDVAIYGGQQVS
jgi:hypothetical protein